MARLKDFYIDVINKRDDVCDLDYSHQQYLQSQEPTKKTKRKRIKRKLLIYSSK